ncbi:hypothetical protein TWF569_008524 [Orbilia oligospora]|uniref:Cytidine deaminase n=2 Tax=Orbilia oligospora TaxID=2813651 RepID=G1XBD9_ARTOA|nr:hypothetical protein AOL_s00078g236 [Orbilia oligospora ATCC 24927]KAF3090820.1 hypothetical protein TWF102_009022 [Orbilia oligospora]EGX49747.1 hypothetical protein AOL_s00078g236 [Orbilia oligospora ATCC 24927]KAF3113927.1 hypothetical protein TWF706_009283 [Orbilia oligospora]KAF3116761.1 hypothetical protein TWF103_008513 [Orbilia oligospora]KAF3123528.1 hypothetical protein TWF703_000740 [Orbilia oligospora]
MSENTTIHGLTSTEVKTLGEHAVSAKSLAYCPYSNFRVGCAILCADGSYVLGANIENASYPVTICAERTAFGKAVVDGKRESGGFKAVGVSTDISPPASPCGMCRQFIREFCDLKTPIFMWDSKGEYIVMTLEQLLPMSFGPDQLHKPDPNKGN